MEQIKRILIILMCLHLLTACGMAKIENPTKDTVKKDIQAYISELIDEDAEIQYLQQNEIEEEGDELVISCAVSYGSIENSYKDEFILTYVKSGKTWELSRCKVNAEYDGRSVKKNEEEPGEEEQETEEVKKAEKDSVIQMSDDLSKFQFELEGVVYELPIPYQKMVENGWELDTYSGKYTEESELDANSYTWVYLTNGAVRINADIINMSGDTRMLKDCTIGSITIYAKNNLDFKVAKGIGCTSSKEEVEAAFGTPTGSSSGDGYQQMKYSLDTWQYTSFYFSDDKINNNIEIKNYTAIESDETEVTDEVPEYLASYKKPETLGDDVTETVFELDGVLYRLPCTISSFTENGWEVTSDSVGSLGAGNHAYGGLRIQKGDYKLDIGLYNFSKKAALSENCAVYQISIDSYKDRFPGDFVKLPGGISLASSPEDVASVYSAFEKNEGTNSVSYNYSSDNYAKSIKYYFSLDPNYISRNITIKNENWDY